MCFLKTTVYQIGMKKEDALKYTFNTTSLNKGR